MPGTGQTRMGRDDSAAPSAPTPALPRTRGRGRFLGSPVFLADLLTD
ncbi:MAG: hypothetical protein JWQ90_1210, partial [Hydrocarboniphaga sp.]|nr:hypothetical protein [Hydrocarboniphaga sp.]